jgi:hypothetical protein
MGSSSSQVYKIGICHFSVLQAALTGKKKTGRLKIRIMCLGGATGVPIYLCFCDGLVQSVHRHHLIEN